MASRNPVKKRDIFHKYCVFKRDFYKKPNGEPGGLSLRIHGQEIADYVENGAKWEQLAHLYQISEEDLKLNFSEVYNRARARLEVRLLANMIASSEESPAMSKWLSIQWLGMKGEPAPPELTEQLSGEEIDTQLNNLLGKLSR
jgi:hypothetical protein